MADPLSLAETQLQRLRSRVKEAKTNIAGCQLLVTLAERTLAISRELEATKSESSVFAVLELLQSALGDAQEAIEKCCNAAFFTALLQNESYTLSLHHSAEKLGHALTQIPLSSLKMSTDFQNDIDELSTQIRGARFEERATTSHHVKALKDALKRAFRRSHQEHTDTEIDPQLRPQELTLNKEDVTKDSVMLGNNEDETQKEIKKQRRLDFSPTIAKVSATSYDVSAALSIKPDLKDCLCCPLSKQIMRDPVVLKDSGMTYDRASIDEWIRQGHQHDPLTKVGLVSKGLVPLHVLRIVCQTMLKQSEASSSIVDNAQEELPEQLLEPGLYEGQGELFVGSKMCFTSQLLILEPAGEVVGCTLYEGRGFQYEESVAEIGHGKWDGDTQELSFKDSHYCYHGGVERLDNDVEGRLRWNRNIFVVNDQVKEHASPLVYSRLSKKLANKLHPTILLMEGELESALNRITYKSKLVLSLEVDSTAGGWMFFESRTLKTRLVGRIIKGRWDENGSLSFSVNFAPENGPSDCIDVFNVAGIVGCDGMLKHQTFTSVVNKAKNEDISQNLTRIPTLLNGVKKLDYPIIHEASKPWFDLLSNPSRLFQMSRNFDFESSQDGFKTKSNVEQRRRLDSPRIIGGSSLHTSSKDNPTLVAKKLITNAANVKQHQFDECTLVGHPRYETFRQVGSGRFGFVAHAKDRKSNNDVAIKFIPRGARIDEHVKRELLNSNHLHHPHVVQLRDVFLTDHYLAIVMEYEAGGNLRDYIDKSKGISEDMARWFFQQLIIGLDYIHKMQIVNRDIKLENILLSGDQWPLVKICDFGLSKCEDVDSAPHSYVGTRPYMAPEVIRNVESEVEVYDGKKADIWSCGLLLYVMLVHRFPFEQPNEDTVGNTFAIYERIMSGKYYIPQGIMSDECADLIRRILVVDPNKRASISEIQQHEWYQRNLPEHTLSMNDVLDSQIALSDDEVMEILDEARQVQGTSASQSSAQI